VDGGKGESAGSREKNGLPVIVAMPTTPVGAGGLEADTHRKDHSGFFEWQNARLCGDWLEFLLAWKNARQDTCGSAKKGRVGASATCSVVKNLTLKQMLDSPREDIGSRRAPGLKIPHGLALGVAYANTAFSRLVGREPSIPVEGVKIARHKMFVDCSRAKRETWISGGTGGCSAGNAPCAGTKRTATSPRAAPKRMAHAAA